MRNDLIKFFFFVSILVHAFAVFSSPSKKKEPPQDPPAPVYWQCYKCHKDDGVSWVREVPKIKGQNKEYLTIQILNFQSGLRKDNLLHLMPDIVKKLTREQIDEVTTHYSTQDPTEKWKEPTPLKEEEKKIYELGQRLSRVCYTCHERAEVRPAARPDWPYISGQNKEALEMILDMFIQGKRENPKMDFIKRPPFNHPDSVKALAFYLSRQKPPKPDQ